MDRYLLRVTMILVAWLAIASMALGQSTVEYIHTDALGTPVAMTNSAGIVIERSTYEPYGQLINRPSMDGPGFTGHVQDSATGLTYMQQRYYDPAVGLFLSVDPVRPDGETGALFNRYMYAANSPYTFVDPDGRCTGSRLVNGDGTCVSTGDFTTNGRGPTMPGARTVVHQAAIEAQTKFDPKTAMAANDPPASRNVFRIRNSTLSFPGTIPIRSLVLSNYEFEAHIKVRHASEIGEDDAGRFYRSVLNRTTSQASFSKFIQDSINTGVISYVGPYGPDPRDIRVIVHTVRPVGTTPTGLPTTTLAIGLQMTGAPGVWYIKTAFPLGL